MRGVAHGGDLDLIDEIVAADYIQHNSNAEQGREGLRSFFMQFNSEINASLGPEKTLHEDLIAEGDLVVRRTDHPSGMLVDIWRVADGKLQEHWDAFRPAPGQERLAGF